MGTTQDYAQWIVQNKDLQGTPDFEKVVKAYEQSKLESQFEDARYKSVLDKEDRSPLKVMGQGALRGVTGLADLAVSAMPYQQVQRGVEALKLRDISKLLPEPQVTNLAKQQGLIVPQNEPNTPLLKGLSFASEMGASGGINPRNLAKAALPELGRFGAMTLGGTTAQQLTEGAGFNPLAQAGATMIGQGVPGILTSMRSNVGDIARESLKGVTPEQIKLSKLLMQRAENMGTPLTSAEALAQVTGTNKLTNVQRIVENTGSGVQRMADFMGKRPEGNVTVLGQQMENISPTVSGALMPKEMAQTAQDFIARSEKGLTGGVEPYYRNAIGEMKNIGINKPLPILPTEVKQLSKNPAIDDAINHVITDKYSGATGLTPNQPDTLISAKKYLDAQYSKFSNKMTESYDKGKAANAYSASRQLDNYLTSKSPSYAKGSEIYEKAQQNVIQPRKEGMLGQLAETGGTTEAQMAQQSNLLMPQAPRATSPEEIKSVVKLLRRQDPTVVPSWTRQNLEGIFAETAQKLQSGPNQFGGANFAKTIVGNDLQKQNLKTLISEGASPQAWQGFETMLDVFQAQGKRQGAGSQTAYNQELQQQLRGQGLGKVALTPTKPSNIVNFYEKVKYGQNTDLLAKLLTDKQGITKLEELAKTKPNSAKAQVLTNSLLGGYSSLKEPIEENK